MNRKIIISVSIIAALSLYIVLSRVRWSSDVPSLSRWEGRADELVIARADVTVRLFRKEGKWLVGDKGYPADARAADGIEKRINEIALEDLISKKGFYARYDLTPDKYTEVIAKKGGAIARKVKIGKQGPTNRHTFVMIDDRPEIYLAEGTFEQMVNKNIDDFRDREVLKIPRGDVTEFSVQYLGRTFTFGRAEEKDGGDRGKEKGKDGAASGGKKGPAPWVCLGQEAVKLEEGKVTSLLAALDPLRASSFPDIAKESLAGSVCTVRVKTRLKEITLMLYRKDDAKFLAAVSEGPFVYEVEKWSVERFFLNGIDSLRAGDK